MTQTQTLPLPVVLIDAQDAAQVPKTAGWEFMAPGLVTVGAPASGAGFNGTRNLEDASDQISTPASDVVLVDAQDPSQAPATAGWEFMVGVSNVAVNNGPKMNGDCLGNAITDQRHPGMVA